MIIGSNQNLEIGDLLYRGQRNVKTGQERGKPIKCIVVKICTMKEFIDSNHYTGELTPMMKTARYYEVKDL